MIDLLLPATNGGAAAQVTLVVVLAGVGLYLTRRHRDFRILVIGVSVLTLGVMAVRTVH